MNIIAVDDEPLVLASLLKQLEIVFPGQPVRGFSRPTESLAAMQDAPADIAFLDMEMPGISGLELGTRYKEINPSVNLIFVTAYSEYAVDAFKVRASGYLLKPVTEEAIREEMSNLRMPMPPTSRVTVRTFGNFEVCVDGVALHFARSKSKELFAMLIDRQGGGIGNAEAYTLLWPDKEYNFSIQRQFQTVVSEMYKTFLKYTAQDVIIRRRGVLSVDTTKVDCDLYRMLHGDMLAMNLFHGQYMTDYEWASLPEQIVKMANSRTTSGGIKCYLER